MCLGTSRGGCADLRGDCESRYPFGLRLTWYPRSPSLRFARRARGGRLSRQRPPSAAASARVCRSSQGPLRSGLSPSREGGQRHVRALAAQGRPPGTELGPGAGALAPGAPRSLPGPAPRAPLAISGPDRRRRPLPWSRNEKITRRPEVKMTTLRPQGL